ncbi:MAG: hypothetical protein NC934_07155, partial [Candidatus Omnitrophica bacterium]|nr:hypothetical protein [Candidatus Omnitrophota bacterium]
IDINDEEKILEFFNSSLKVLKLGGEMKSVFYECEKINKSFENIFDFKKPEIKNGELVKILYLTPGLSKNFSFGEFLSGSIKLTNLSMKSKNYGDTMILKKGIEAGSVFYVKVNDRNSLDEIWLNPKDGKFIGCDLIIYSKYKEG